MKIAVCSEKQTFAIVLSNSFYKSTPIIFATLNSNQRFRACVSLFSIYSIILKSVDPIPFGGLTVYFVINLLHIILNTNLY